MLEASAHCLTRAQTLKISVLEGTTEVTGLAESVSNVNVINNLINSILFIK